MIETVDDFLEKSKIDDIYVLEYDNEYEIIKKGIYRLKNENIWRLFDRKFKFKTLFKFDVKPKEKKINNKAFYQSLISDKYLPKLYELSRDWEILKLNKKFNENNNYYTEQDYYIMDKKNRKIFKLDPSFHIIYDNYRYSFYGSLNNIEIEDLKIKYEIVYKFIKSYIKKDLLYKLNQIRKIRYKDDYNEEPIVIRDYRMCDEYNYNYNYFLPIYYGLLNSLEKKEINIINPNKIKHELSDIDVEMIFFNINGEGTNEDNENYQLIIDEVKKRSNKKIKLILYLHKFNYMKNSNNIKEILYGESNNDINNKNIIIRNKILENYNLDYLCSLLDDKDNDIFKKCLKFYPSIKHTFNSTYKNIELFRIFFGSNFVLNSDNSTLMDMSLYEDNLDGENNIDGTLLIDV